MDIVIVAAKRTPMGAFQGALANLTAPELGACAIAAAIAQAGLKGEQIDEAYMGNVLSAGVGQAPARQAVLKAGLPESVPCTTVNKVCGSGMKAVMLAADSLRLGDTDIVIAGGMESMSRAPYLLDKARSGFRMGHQSVLDHMFLDGLQDAYEGQLMGHYAQLSADRAGLARSDMDAFAIASLTRALAAQQSGAFKAELAQVTVGDTLLLAEDEQPAKARPDKIPHLKPAFSKQGTITAANASSISDGAAALILMRAETAAQLGLPVLAMAGCNLPHDKVNVNGGACALGHPLGASGARILVTLIHALHARSLKRGVASLCIGGGEATAVAIELS